MTRAHDLTFIGPSAEVLERFASKAGTRELLAAHGLPMVPGSQGMLRDDEHALEEAERVGYPLLIKPSAGGGGKGMRMVRTPRELQQALTVCRSEARAAFGDDSLYLEKWLEQTRHVEVQVMIDNYGHGVHVGERDCSVQRRHQKIVEEAPSPAIDDATRTELTECGDPGRHRCRLPNVGTLEFLVDRTGHYYFIEINARIQVEHPVTEMLSGIDIVAEQIRLAAGEELGYGQDAVRLRGHAIEFRINAEDVRADFQPQAGRVEHYVPPGGAGIRMETHLYSGYEVPPYYDSLLGKLIVWGPDRDSRHRAFPRGPARAARRRHRDQHPVPSGHPRGQDVPVGWLRHQPARPQGRGGLPQCRAGRRTGLSDQARTREEDHDRQPGAGRRADTRRAAHDRASCSSSSRTAGRSCSSTASSRRTASAATSAARRR